MLLSLVSFMQTLVIKALLSNSKIIWLINSRQNQRDDKRCGADFSMQGTSVTQKSISGDHSTEN